jgi:hypothetical protein
MSISDNLQVQRDAKIDKLSQDSYIEQAVEILTALKKLGDTLRAEEEAFLQSHASDSLRQFEAVSTSEIGGSFNVLFCEMGTCQKLA